MMVRTGVHEEKARCGHIIYRRTHEIEKTLSFKLLESKGLFLDVLEGRYPAAKERFIGRVPGWKRYKLFQYCFMKRNVDNIVVLVL